MKKLRALALALLLCLSLFGCAKRQPAALLAAGVCQTAAQALAQADASAVTAQAQTDRAALEQLSCGNCEFAVVREESLRDALTGGGDYNGQALDNLERLDNLLLGAFCVFSTAGQPQQWTRGVETLVLEDGDVGEVLASQLTQALQLTNVRACTREELAQRAGEGGAWVALGLFLPGEALIDTMVKAGATLVETPVELTMPEETRSMAKTMLPLLYDGMPRQEAWCLYGALVTAGGVDEALRAQMLRTATGLACHVQQLPSLPLDEE